MGIINFFKKLYNKYFGSPEKIEDFKEDVKEAIDKVETVVEVAKPIVKEVVAKVEDAVEEKQPVKKEAPTAGEIKGKPRRKPAAKKPAAKKPAAKKPAAKKPAAKKPAAKKPVDGAKPKRKYTPRKPKNGGAK